jgi:hypothetical protein
LYLIGKIWYRNDNFWIGKSYCYFAVGIGTLVDWFKETSIDKPKATILVAVLLL